MTDAPRYFGYSEDIDDPEAGPYQEPVRVEEQFYDEPTIKHIEKMFPNRKAHLDTLFRIYKFIAAAVSKKKKNIPEKTKEDVLADIMDSKYSLDMEAIAASTQKELIDNLKQNGLFHKQIAAVPVFIDFAYMYYVQHFDREAPIHKLPMFLPKYRMIMATLKAPCDDLFVSFENCIENRIIMDMRVEIPPYHLRTDLTDGEIREKLKIVVVPALKDILEMCLKLDPPTISIPIHGTGTNAPPSDIEPAV
jgi:hypothetical protein